MDARLNDSTTSMDVEGQAIGSNPRVAYTSGAAKCYIICSIILVIVAIMTPIGIFVIAPPIAQHILDSTTISMPNATLNPCGTLHAWGHIHAIFEANTLGLSATLNPYNQALSTTTCLDYSQDPPAMKGGWFCNNATKTLIGTYESPELHLTSGKNDKHLDIGVALASPTIVINAIVVPVMLFHKRMRMILEAQDISISVLGIPLSGLTLNKVLTCSVGTVAGGITPPVDIPNRICLPPNMSSTPYNNEGYTMTCVSGDTEPLSPATTAAPIAMAGAALLA